MDYIYSHVPSTVKLGRNAWINWSRMYVDMVQHLCDMLDAEHIEYADYKVIQTFCDCCTNIARQAVHEQIEPLQ